jgi:hypothetical protein
MNISNDQIIFADEGRRLDGSEDDGGDPTRSTEAATAPVYRINVPAPVLRSEPQPERVVRRESSDEDGATGIAFGAAVPAGGPEPLAGQQPTGVTTLPAPSEPVALKAAPTSWRDVLRDKRVWVVAAGVLVLLFLVRRKEKSA